MTNVRIYTHNVEFVKLCFEGPGRNINKSRLVGKNLSNNSRFQNCEDGLGGRSRFGSEARCVLGQC